MININRLLERGGETHFISTQAVLDEFPFSQSDLDRWVLDRYLTVKKNHDGSSLWNMDELERMADRLEPVVSSSWISTNEVEELYGIGIQMLKQLSREGIVAPKRVSDGGDWFWSRQELQRFVDEFYGAV